MYLESYTLWVGNLGEDLSEDDLIEYFEESGIAVVSCKIVRDKGTHSTKGYAFVEVFSEDDLMKAIEECDGQELAGRELEVRQAHAPLGEEDEDEDEAMKNRRRRKKADDYED